MPQPDSREAMVALRAQAACEMANASIALDRILGDVERRRQATEHDQAQLERFLEEFALFSDLSATATDVPQSGIVRIDVGRLNAAAHDLASQLTQATILRDMLRHEIRRLRVLSAGLELDELLAVPTDQDVNVDIATTAAREEERGRLSREIHDGPAQILTNLLYVMQLSEQAIMRNPSSVTAEFDRMRSGLRVGVNEIRSFMFNLQPTMLVEQGLVPTLAKHLSDTASFFERVIRLDVPAQTLRLGDDVELALFRICQEAIQNVIKHAGADATATVSLREIGDKFEVVIHDDGRGMQSDSGVGLETALGGSGITGMRERARLVGGRLDISSSPGNGVTIRLSVPLPSSGNEHERLTGQPRQAGHDCNGGVRA